MVMIRLVLPKSVGQAALGPLAPKIAMKLVQLAPSTDLLRAWQPPDIAQRPGEVSGLPAT